ncbi:facilitated trehalose transporter Tret1-like [Spodoptera litura]|uniref:Facilitated trehalose transporter Tret1-like n=1 Tax=Spodoptera litura TaxID=69820 RepID=A0A9J7DNZ6_SPOLT|nr:facilitated trehalose transporter Tret1-like [Spodoptera litura]
MVYVVADMKNVPVPVSRIRSVSAQLIASMAPNLLLLDLGMAISFATIVIPDLLNAKTGLSFTDTQASWFGSLSFLTQPLGAVISGPIVDYVGRKKATFLVNLPHVMAWIIMYFAWNVPVLFIGNALLGIGTGIMEAPINSYVSEISEPSVRGALCTVTQLFLSIGVFAMYFLGSVVTWRVAAIVCISIPFTSMLLVLIGAVPDTPVWLLSRGREKDALKSLCFLRGWTTADNVKEEFDELVVYSKNLDGCVICWKKGQAESECNHSKMNRIRRFFVEFNIVMLCKETLRPLCLSMLYFTFYVMSGLTPIKPNMVNVCSAMGMADDSKNIVVMVGVITLLASITVIGVIKSLGKRKLGITAMLGTAISCTGLSVYAHTQLDDKVFSYDSTTFPEEKSMVPLIFFYILTVCTGFNVSWIILGEVFPFRSRASAQGWGAAWNYVVTFIGTKTLINLETHFRLTGAFATYAAFAYVGTIYLYFFMPETEGISLQEIETYYKGKLRIFADDWFINLFKKKK